MTGLFSQALADQQAGRLDEARDKFLRLIAASPAELKAPLFVHLGLVEAARGDTLSSIDAWRTALLHDSQDATALMNLALALHRAGSRDEAAALYEKLIALAPSAAAFSNYGALLREMGLFKEAQHALSEALALEPRNKAALVNRAHLLFQTGPAAEAEAACAAACAADPDARDVFNNWGTLCHRRGALAEAEVYFRTALAKCPTGALNAEILSNLGALLTERGKPDEAETYLDQAIRLAPASSAAHYNRGLCLLTQQRLDEGWPEIEWRWRPGMISAAAPRLPMFDTPMWRGEPLEDKTILILAEQAYGDEIMCARYATLLAGQGARVIWATRAPLHAFLTRLPGIDHAVTLDDAPKAAQEADYWLFAMSLPGLLQTHLLSIPHPQPPARDPAQSAAWQTWLADRIGTQAPKPRLIGLNNMGKPYPPGRSIPFSALLGALEGEKTRSDVRFVSICREEGASSDLQTLNQERALNPVMDASSRLQNFDDTANLLQELDLLITIDSAPAHLAGTLGIPCWTLLKYGPDWRWFSGRTDSPWYPSMRLFRQKIEGDWMGALTELSQAFAAF